MLRDLINPYLEKDPPLIDDLEKMLELGILAWNIAISESSRFPGFEQMLEATLKSIGTSKSEMTIIKGMMLQKQQKYANHLDLIEDFELNEDAEGNMHLLVTCKSFMDITDDYDLDNEEMEDSQYEEGFIDRSALLVKPTPYFWNFFKEADKDFDEPKPPIDYTTYLIEELDSNDETIKWLKKNFDKIFLDQLEDWIDEAFRPKKRNYKMFQEFFEIQFSSMVLDLEEEPVIKNQLP